MFNTFYSKLYSQDSTLIHGINNRNAPCTGSDDIAMNFVIANYTGYKPIIVPKTINERLDLPEPNALSSKKNWTSMRTKCVQWLSHHFNDVHQLSTQRIVKH